MLSSRSVVVALFLACGSSLFAASGPADIGNTVLLATTSLRLGPNVEVRSGDVVVNAGGKGPFLGDAALTLDQDVSTPAGFALRADSIAIDRGATVAGDVFFNRLKNDGTIGGARITPLTLPVFASLPPLMGPGSGTGRNVTVPNGGSSTFAAGVYGNLTLGTSATALFTGGTYTFANIINISRARLLFDAASNVVVTGNVLIGLEAVVGPTDALRAASQVVFHVHGIGGVAVGRASSVAATIYAPNGTIVFDRDLRAEGSFLARYVLAGPGAHFTLNSAYANLPPAADSQNVFTSGDAPVPVTLTGSDPEGGDLTFSIVTTPTKGTLSPLVPGAAPVASATLNYTPFTVGDVIDSFTFRVTDPHGATATAVVTINPPSGDQAAAPPGTVTAFAGFGTMVQDQIATFGITGDAPVTTSLTFRILSGPLHGTIADLTQDSDVPQRGAAVTYAPTLGYVGSDSFDFEACGTIGDTTVCSKGTFSIRITVGENNGR